jgi:oligo-1,6-glucosidase
MKDEKSVLNFYRQLLALRHKEPGLLEGNLKMVNESDPDVLTYVRRYKGEMILVMLNMSAKDQQVGIDFPAMGYPMPKVSVLLTSFHKPLPPAGGAIPMEPYSAFIAKITK